MRENGEERCKMVVVAVNHALHLRSFILGLEHSRRVPLRWEIMQNILALAWKILGDC
jgi:hypothetical protein